MAHRLPGRALRGRRDRDLKCVAPGSFCTLPVLIFPIPPFSRSCGVRVPRLRGGRVRAGAHAGAGRRPRPLPPHVPPHQPVPGRGARPRRRHPPLRGGHRVRQRGRRHLPPAVHRVRLRRVGARVREGGAQGHTRGCPRPLQRGLRGHRFHLGALRRVCCFSSFLF